MVVERVKELWYTWIPGWLPVCGCICFGAWWVGQYTQSINDRLKTLEEQVKAIQDYIRTDHQKGYALPPLSQNQEQDSGLQYSGHVPQ